MILIRFIENVSLHSLGLDEKHDLAVGRRHCNVRRVGKEKKGREVCFRMRDY